MTSAQIRRYLKYLAAERDAAHLYRSLAEVTTGDRREALVELAAIENRHAEHWADMLTSSGVELPQDPGMSATAAVMVERARRSSLDAVLPDLEAAERDAQGEYDAEPDSLPGMAEEERRHAAVFRAMRGGRTAELTDASPTAARAAINEVEPWHRADRSGSARAAVFGVSDGLVSNTALVMGFAGAGAVVSSGTVLFAGVAGLLAGAFSMAAGEFVSMSSQRDLFNREIEMEARELSEKPEEERQELELLYRAKGIDAETARRSADQIMSDPEVALDALAREELGLDPDSLGAPWKAAAASFAAFAVGAVVPVIPYIVLSGTPALILAISMAVVALVVVGGTVGRMSGAGVHRSALRQFLVGGGAAAVTFGIGHLVGGFA